LTKNSIFESLIILLSNSNTAGWIRNYGTELNWTFKDGTRIISSAVEHEDVGSWLETYHELSEKILIKIDGTYFSGLKIEEILNKSRNFIEFKYTLYFRGDEIIYHYIQYGDGFEVARTILIPPSAIDNNLACWISNAIDEDWCVTLSEEEL
jgi:hypothetical protein